MSKCHKWFKSLIEALEKDPCWDIDTSKTASKPIPDRAKQTIRSKEKNRDFFLFIVVVAPNFFA